MNKKIEHINSLISALRMPAIDFETLYKDRNNLTPLESIETHF